MPKDHLKSVNNTTNGSLQRMASALYYGSIPALTVDAYGYVADYNLALEAVFGDVLSGRRYSPLRELLELLSSRVTRGTIIVGDDDYQTKTECYFDSPQLGQVFLTSSVMVCHDPLTSAKMGEVLFWDVVRAPGNDSFHELYRSKLDHQLIWDTYAWSYDRVLPLIPYYQDVLARHAAVLTSSFDGPVIDLGAGTGNLAELLIFAGRSVTAVDSSRAMLEKLRSKQALVAVLGTRLTMIETSAEALPMIDDQSYSGVSLQLALFDMPRPELALRGAVRLLRPGGSMIVTDLKRSFKLEPLLEECERQLRYLGLYESLADDLHRVVRSNRDLAPGSQSNFRIENVFDLLAAEGFQGLSMKDSHLGQCATVAGQKPYDTKQIRSST
jgi:ubiquinone/menaquinone biosynthesis C-methylase UbiE